jgi:hypothetical protein
VRTVSNSLTDLQEQLDAVLPGKVWLRILEAFAPSGAADGLQLRLATGLDRDKLRRALDKLEVSGVGLPPLIRLLDHSITRVGATGRAPKVYLLGESGAGLLNSNGHQGILPCELSDDLSIAHALAMLSVHLGANQAGLTTYTDQYLRYGDGKHIRPDHRIVLPDSHELLIEVEQTANAKLVPRILESLANKQEFFRSEESREFLPEVRMLLNVRRGREWTRTLTVWQEACNLVAQQQNEALLFRLLAMPLDEFLNAPEWEKTSRRWEEPSAYIPQVERKEPKRPYEGSVSVVYPSRRSAQDDYVILSALLERYNETRLNRLDRQPEFAFLDLVILIYSASHSELRDFWQGVSFPDASIYLFKRYLEMHPALMKKLQKSFHMGQSRNRGSAIMTVHRMQQAINLFLGYHGWRSDGLLRVEAIAEGWSGTGPFGVHVKKVGFWNFSQDKSREEKIFPALQWVLWVLFEYAEELGLGRPDFW